jgi:hypothetical protein
MFLACLAAAPAFGAGRCCLPSGNCIETDESTCQSRGGTFSGEGTTCPANHICGAAHANSFLDPTLVSDGAIPFYTTGTTTDGPPACGNIANDIWMLYIASADGTLTASTCGSAGFDTVLVAYVGNTPPSPTTQLACNDDACGLQSTITIPVLSEATYLIRIGGFNGATGTGLVNIALAAAPTGRCCTTSGNCLVCSQADCDGRSGTYGGDGTTCPKPHCSADFNGDGAIGTDADIQDFFACLGGNCCPTCGSADFNGDGAIGTDADIESFFSVLGGGPC